MQFSLKVLITIHSEKYQTFKILYMYNNNGLYLKFNQMIFNVSFCDLVFSAIFDLIALKHYYRPEAIENDDSENLTTKNDSTTVIEETADRVNF